MGAMRKQRQPLIAGSSWLAAVVALRRCGVLRLSRRISSASGARPQKSGRCYLSGKKKTWRRHSIAPRRDEKPDRRATTRKLPSS
jgi:hypothetical protein